MKNILFNALLISFIILGCGNSTTSNDQTKSPTSDEKSCLEQYVDTPCDILSADKIIALAGFETSEIEFKEPISMKVAGGFQCVYLWNSGRTEQVKIAGGNIDSKLNDKIDIGHFKIFDENKTALSAEDWFKSTYPIMTEEELANREERYNKKIANGEKNLVEGVLLKVYKNLERTRIENLGDRALVDTHKKMTVGTVIVMDKKVSFQVSVDINKDVQKNLEVAKEVARMVLKACN